MSMKVRRNNNAPRNNRGRSGGRPNPRRNNNGSKSSNLSQNLHKAKQAKEKYVGLAQECMSSGDRVQAENYYQHVDHYVRIINSLTKEKELIEARQAEEQEQKKLQEDAESKEQAAEVTKENSPMDKEVAVEEKPKGGEESAEGFLPDFLTAEA